MVRFVKSRVEPAHRQCTHKKQKKHKMRFHGENGRFLENFEILFPTYSWRHRFTCCVQISRKSSTGKWMKRCFVLLTKIVSKMLDTISSRREWSASGTNTRLRTRPAKCILAPFCTRLAKSAESLQQSVSRNPISLYKIASQSVPICWSYSQKVILYE